MANEGKDKAENVRLLPLIRWFSLMPLKAVAAIRHLDTNSSEDPLESVLRKLAGYLDSYPPEQHEAILSGFRKECPPGFSFSDFVAAASIYRNIESSAIYAYDKPDGLAQLQKEFPGIPNKILKQVIDTLWWTNR
jgi:hypothetical protein